MKIEITTDGGLTGRGLGNVSVDSEEDAAVATALRAANVASWAGDYPSGGRDVVRYTMRVGAKTVSWVDGAAIPNDLRALFAAVWSRR